MSPKSLIKSITPAFALSAYHMSLAFLAALWYRFPSESMVVIGVTGTKGKSSTIFMLSRVLEEAGVKVAVSSSLMFKIKENEWLNPYHMTMSGRFKLQQFLYQAKQAGCTHAIIETTSEGIKQFRHKFINFDAAVFTNLSPEHIEAHGGFENYKRAKGQLFAALAYADKKIIGGKAIEKISVLNFDDGSVDYYSGFHADKKYGFSAEGKCVTAKEKGALCFSVTELKSSATGISFNLEGENFEMPLLGDFNIYNAVCAAVTAKSLGVDFSAARAALRKIEEIAGRMKFINSGQKFTAVIDLAHTPSSFEAVFKAVQLIKKPHGRVIAVFGSAGGGRDKWKRPEMGKIAARYADYIILTNEDPYDENPAVICGSIEEGVKVANFPGVLETIYDRKKAIARAVNVARWNDLVLFLGKGTEQTMVVGEESIPWDEQAEVLVTIKDMLYDRK
ncbi:MAG TPA: UDP-N-acetylmuramoyl-L-alanyl-D-glutamate--2,6-diaminopimelate ligase [Candidatus Paceibacterota bacterium]